MPTMTKQKQTYWLLALVAGFVLTFGTAEAKEPISAPAEFGSIPSPRRITKSTKPTRRPNQDLLELVDEAIAISARRYLVANEHSPWQIYHGMNAFRRDFMLELDGELVPAIDWMSTTNPQFRGLPWFEKTIHGGRAHRFTSPYHFEGHPNQSLALLVMCNLPLEHRFEIDGGSITVADIVENAKVDLNPREELTWTLWFLTHYLDSEETWKTRYGQTWSIEKLVQDQIRTQVTKAACGGTHNLYSLAVARNNHVRDGGRIRGVWLQADQKLKRYTVAARSIQRRDGSFPTQYFRGYGNPKTFSEQIASSGHMMEWLSVAVSDEELESEWMERGIRYVAQKLVDYRNESAECGPLYHTAAALVLYRDRVNGLDWPDPSIQPEPAPSLVIKESLPEIAPNTAANDQSEMEAGEVKVARQPRFNEDGVVLDAKPAAKPADSVTKQSEAGALSISIDEDELDFEMPAQTDEPEKQVEILAAPEKSTTTK